MHVIADALAQKVGVAHAHTYVLLKQSTVELKAIGDFEERLAILRCKVSLVFVY